MIRSTMTTNKTEDQLFTATEHRKYDEEKIIALIRRITGERNTGIVSNSTKDNLIWGTIWPVLLTSKSCLKVS